MNGLRQAAISIVVLAVAVPAAFAQTRSTDDWKAYALMNTPPGIKGGMMELFYLGNQITRLPDGRLRVWTKAVRRSVLNHTHLDKRTIKRIAMRIITYQPPLSRLARLTPSEREGVIAAEVIADDPEVPTVFESLDELDCKNKKYRILSMAFFAHPLWDTSIPGHWGYVAPDTNEAALLALTCSSGKRRK